MTTRSGRVLMAGLALATAGLAARPAKAATIQITANIVASETWTANNEYILTKPIYVTSGATLTIAPGTVVRGNPESTPGANDPGTLIISRGSKLFAVGTPTQPIIFTDLFDDNFGGNLGTPPYDTPENALGLVGQWGGVILLGQAYVANNTLAGPLASREVQIEGLTAAGGLGLYGNGGLDDDDSGSLSYVSIRYGGFNLSPNNEINGLTLGGVGRQTDIDYIEVFQTKDDLVEIFGGTVNVKHLLLANNGDDGLDYDEGWRGKGQFIYIQQGTPGTDKSDRGLEMDGGNAPDGSQPFGLPTLYNVTAIGLGQKSYTAKETNLGMIFRDNAGGRIYNSFFGDFGGPALIIEGTSSACRGPLSAGERSVTPYVADGVFQRGPASTFQLELENDTFWCNGTVPGTIPTNTCSVSTGTLCCSTADCPGGETCTSTTGPLYGIEAGKLYADNGVFTNAALKDQYLACASPLPIRTLTRGSSGSASIPDPIVSIDPRPAPGSPLLTTDRIPPNDGFFSPAPYRGAFAPDENWGAGWSVISRMGYFPPKPQVTVSANLTASETWTADNEYILTKPIYVTSGATLTIAPGTVVRGNPESTPGANDPGTLIISRGSKLFAVGTPTQPIIFTDLFDDNVGGHAGTAPYDTPENALGLVGQWGGVILLGQAYVANNTLAGPLASREVQIEGLTAAGGLGLYGNGGLDDDDSGSLSYVSIRYGGFNLSPNNEINGLTLGGVGRQTDIDYIEVFQTKDDLVEIFGGTVNVKHLLLANNGDDGLDYDEGWRGKGQFIYIQQGTPGTDKSDRGLEMDGGNAPDGSQPFGLPTLYNVTAIGLGQKSYTAKETNLGMIFRDNAGGRIYNSFFGDFGGPALIIEGTSSACRGPLSAGERSVTPYVADGVFQRGPASTFQLELENDTFWCNGTVPGTIPTNTCSVSTGTLCCSTADCPGGETCTSTTGPLYGIEAGKLYADNGVFTNAALKDQYLACASPLPIRTLMRNGTGSASIPDPIINIDPRPAPGSPLLTTDRIPPNDGFFSAARYRGAFAPGENWGQGWSIASRMGYYGACGTLNPNAVPDEVQGLRLVTGGGVSWSPVSDPFGIERYDLLRSTTASTFAGATCVETNSGDTVASDAANPPVGQIFFYGVRSGNDCGEGPVGFNSNGVEIPGVICP